MFSAVVHQSMTVTSTVNNKEDRFTMRNRAARDWGDRQGPCRGLVGEGNPKSSQMNIVDWLFIAKWSNSSWSVFEKCENPIGVLLVSC
jgi:hypothetical protein